MKRRITVYVISGIIIMALWLFYDSQSRHVVKSQAPETLLIPVPYQRTCVSRTRVMSMLETQLSHIKRRPSIDCLDEKISFIPELPVIYVITPTFTRPVQKAELTRLSQAFMLVPNLHWIVVEDSADKTDLVRNLLLKTGLLFTHLNIPTPKNWKLTKKDPHWSKPRGVIQRNAALQWLRNDLSSSDIEGVFYFADDDNTYSLELFEEMRYVKTVGVWPVGLVGGVKVERPKVVKGNVTGWLTVWGSKRPFAIDMAGFAINLKRFLSRPKGKFAFEVEKGYQESEFLRHFVDSLSELEPRAELCTKVYVWHTRTEKPLLTQEEALAKSKKPPTDDGIEV